jgi:hypothetical protein
MSGNYENRVLIERIICSVVENTLRIMTGVPILPICLTVYTGRLFYNVFARDPFKISMEDLESHIIVAVEERKIIKRKLEEVDELIKKVESRKIEGNLELLNSRKKQLEEQLKLVDSKIMLANIVKMVRENIELFHKLYGKDRFEKLLDAETYKKVDEALKNQGVKDIDIEALYTYFNNVFPVIIKGGEKPPQPPPTQPPQPPQVPADKVDKLVKEGNVEEWVNLIKEALERNEKIKMPPLRNYNTEGYRNLLATLLFIDTPPSKLKDTIADRFLNRVIEPLKKLAEGKTIEVAPDSSDREYIDQAIEIMCGNPEKEEITETTITKQYKLIVRGKEVIIERKTIRDPETKKAQKITYKMIV